MRQKAKHGFELQEAHLSNPTACNLEPCLPVFTASAPVFEHKREQTLPSGSTLTLPLVVGA